MKIMVKTHDKNALYVVYVSLFVFLREFSHVNAETTVKAKYELPNENTTRFVDPPVSRKDNLQNLGPEESLSFTRLIHATSNEDVSPTITYPHEIVSTKLCKIKHFPFRNLTILLLPNNHAVCNSTASNEKLYSCNSNFHIRGGNNYYMIAYPIYDPMQKNSTLLLVKTSIQCKNGQNILISSSDKNKTTADCTNKGKWSHPSQCRIRDLEKTVYKPSIVSFLQVNNDTNPFSTSKDTSTSSASKESSNSSSNESTTDLLKITPAKVSFLAFGIVSAMLLGAIGRSLQKRFCQKIKSSTKSKSTGASSSSLSIDEKRNYPRRKSQCAGTVDPNQLMAEKFYPLYQPVVHRVPTEHFFIPVSHLFEVHSNQKLWLQHAQEQQQKVYATGTEPEPFLRTLFSVFSDAEMITKLKKDEVNSAYERVETWPVTRRNSVGYEQVDWPGPDSLTSSSRQSGNMHLLGMRQSHGLGTPVPSQTNAEKNFFPLYQPAVHRVPTEQFFIPSSRLFQPHSNQKLWLEQTQQQQRKLFATQPEPFLRTLFSVFSDAEMITRRNSVGYEQVDWPGQTSDATHSWPSGSIQPYPM